MYLKQKYIRITFQTINQTKIAAFKDEQIFWRNMIFVSENE